MLMLNEIYKIKDTKKHEQNSRTGNGTMEYKVALNNHITR